MGNFASSNILTSPEPIINLGNFTNGNNGRPGTINTNLTERMQQLLNQEQWDRSTLIQLRELNQQHEQLNVQQLNRPNLTQEQIDKLRQSLQQQKNMSIAQYRKYTNLKMKDAQFEEHLKEYQQRLNQQYQKLREKSQSNESRVYLNKDLSGTYLETDDNGDIILHMKNKEVPLASDRDGRVWLNVDDQNLWVAAKQTQ